MAIEVGGSRVPVERREGKNWPGKLDSPNLSLANALVSIFYLRLAVQIGHLT